MQHLLGDEHLHPIVKGVAGERSPKSIENRGNEGNMALERSRLRWEIAPWRPFWYLDDSERHIQSFIGGPMWRFPVEERGWLPAVYVFETYKEVYSELFTGCLQGI